MKYRNVIFALIGLLGLAQTAQADPWLHLTYDQAEALKESILENPYLLEVDLSRREYEQADYVNLVWVSEVFIEVCPYDQDYFSLKITKAVVATYRFGYECMLVDPIAAEDYYEQTDYLVINYAYAFGFKPGGTVVGYQLTIHIDPTYTETACSTVVDFPSPSEIDNPGYTEWYNQL
ncbi:MAG: hypothetical protein OHK0053_22370 [Microscillaceae bacterium]